MICRPSITQPLYHVIQRLAQGQRAENCGVWYRRILARLQVIDCVSTSLATPITQTTNNVGVVGATIREANFFAVKTIIRNTGANDAYIYEGEALIYKLASGEEWVMPVAGKLKLEAESLSATTDIEVTTLVRNTCNFVEPVTTPSEEEGGFLV